MEPFVKKTLIALLSYFPLALSITLHAQTTVSYRVLFGVSDTAPTRWDGTFSGERVGKITATEWKFLAGDNIDGQLFHFSTHPDVRFVGASGGSGAPIVPNGFFMLVLLSLLFLRTHNWRVPVNVTDFLSHSRSRTQTPEDTMYGMLDAARAGDTAVYFDTFFGAAAATDSAGDSSEWKNAICYLLDCAKLFVSKRRTLSDRSAE